jgi:predicted ATPase
LHAPLARALAGSRQLVFVVGEGGIGKTSVVDTFVTG